MNISTKLLPVVAVAALFSGCQDEDFGYEAQDIKYQKEFKAAFGDIDPNQDFNLATRASVTVSTSAPSRIKIYAKHGNRFMLVGDYADVNGTQTLGVDVIEGTTELRVSNGSFAQETTVGGSVDFVGGGLTRGIVNTDISTKTTDYFEMSEALVKAWVPVIPERDEGKRPYWGTNLGKVTQDFTYVSQGKFTMYPMFSYTSASDQIGIYYTDQQGAYHEVIVMNNDFGDDLQFQFKNDPQDGRQTGVWYSCSGHQPAYGNGAGLKEVTNDGTHVLDNIAKVQGKGVIIDLPKGTEFGMFIIVNGGIKYYSESRFNGDAAVTDVRNESIEIGQNGAYTVTTDLTKKACHASSFYCTVEGKEYQFLGFEDWDNAANGGGMSDFDLNDFMVLFDGVLPSINDQETPGWILAYEDLGNTFDWDFNDIVAKVQHVSGQDYATFTPLAAVGTLDSYVKYNDNYITGEKATSEIHAMLGATDEAPHAIINGYSKGTPGQSVTFSVPEEFSMTVLGDVSEMGGLTLEVEKEGEEAKAAVIAYNGAGKTPEVLCLPEFWYDNNDAPRFRSEWAWPTEHSSIRYVYPGFATWVSDHTASKDWYKAEPQGERGNEGTVGDNTTGAAVAGAFITNINTGSIVDRVDPKAIKVFSDPLYVALGSNTPVSEIFSTVSNGALSYSSSDASVCNVNNNALYAGKVGEAILTIHQKMGTSENGAKQWPNCDVDVHVIVLNANTMNLGTLDAYNNWSEANALALEAGQDYILYFKSTGGSNGGAYSSSATGEAVTVSDPETPHNMSSNGSITIHASKVGTSEVTVKQARNDSYVAAEKTITVTVSAAATNLSLAQSSVSVGSNNASAYVAIITNNTESTPVVNVTSGSDYFDAVYENGKVKVTGKAVGSGTVKVSQAASASYSAATDVELSVEVTAPVHDLELTSATSITLAAADATSQITASSSTGTVQYEVVEGNSLIEVSDGGKISVKDGPGTAKVRVFVAANDEYLAAEKFVDVNVTWENNTLPEGAVDIKESAKDNMNGDPLSGTYFTDGKTNGLVLVAVMSNDLPDKKNAWSDEKYQFYGANGNWVTAATTNNAVLQKGTNTFEITAAECATFEGTGMHMNFNGASQWVKKFYIMYK